MFTKGNYPLLVGETMLGLQIDNRLGGMTRYYLASQGENLMRVPDEVRESVAFIVYESKEGPKIAGTAFFVGMDIEGLKGMGFVYVVTAKHVIDGISKKSINQKVYLRCNFRNGGADIVETAIDMWKYHPTDFSIDIAVLPWAPDLNLIQFKTLPHRMIVTQEHIEEYRIGVGDEVFITGLFTSHYGHERNLPIVRVGNIALMSEEKVYTRELGKIDAYLIEARSIGGLSGSPVFVQLSVPRSFDGGMHLTQTPFHYYLLGLMHGHWDIPVSNADLVIEDDPDRERVNMGIAIVVPAANILEVINQPEIAEIRKKEEKRLRNETAK